MLRVITGKAGTGKTGKIIKEIAGHVSRGEGRDMLLVPEQYSHEAERELCLACGDRMSLTAEVFSFTGLARRIMAENGGAGKKYLDKGGRMLCMAVALESCAQHLKLYSGGRKDELRRTLLKAVDELKAACVTGQQLRSAAARCEGGLQKKLLDLALVLESYDAVVGSGRLDPADRLSILAAQIPESSIDGSVHVYIDGFTDFTAQELAVVRALLKKGAELTVCLTIDGIGSESELFACSRRTFMQLRAYAEQNNIPFGHIVSDGEQDKTAARFAENMFSYSDLHFDAPEGVVRLFRAGTAAEECELAAAECIRLVRDTGCRWRDIAIAVRGFDDYKAVLESSFAHYDVPLYTARKSDLMSKPLPSYIAAVYEMTGTGWDVDDLIDFLHSGLSGLSPEEADELEKYVFTWQLRESAWKRQGSWQQNPDGYVPMNDESARRLETINAARQKLAGPLLKFEQRARAAVTAAEQAMALAEYFEESGLPRTPSARAESLRSEGREILADEYLQLWELCVAALEQCAAILGDMQTDMQAFGRLYLTVLSQYDVGTIPVSLDRVTAGDFDRMRRRSIKHLIVLGCTDERIPRESADGGAFTGDERRRLLDLEIDVGGGSEADLYREFSLAYNCFTLPAETITLCRPLSDGRGNMLRPSVVFKRAGAMFGVNEESADMDILRLSAPGPALTMAACSINEPSPERLAAADYFMQFRPELFHTISAAAKTGRGALSPEAVDSLYGSKIRLSASKIDQLAKCRFAYFCLYGMKAREYEPAGFRPPEIGTFIHFVLEKTARRVAGAGGWTNVGDEELKALVDDAIEEYIKTGLNGMEEKTPRFIHLFERLRSEVQTITLDMARELRSSDFEPCKFEFDFSGPESGAVSLPAGSGEIQLTGVADRIDSYERDGKLYVRVVDYKSGRKELSLSDIWYGTGLQMLLYLFALCKKPEIFGASEAVPAGVMYVPAKDSRVKAENDLSDEEIERERMDMLRRSGLVLEDSGIIEAWEHGPEKYFIPLKFDKKGNPKTDSLVSAERFGVLSRHIEKTLGELSGELKNGNISAGPLYTSEDDNACVRCPFKTGCGFVDGENGEYCRKNKKLKPEQVWELMEGDGSNG